MPSSDQPPPPDSTGTIHYTRMPERDFQLAAGDDALIREIENHIQKYIGTPKTVHHEVISDVVHVDIHVVEPTPERPHYTLVTSGMSERPMAVPEGADAPRHIELVVCLPASWPMDQDSWKDPRHNWPMQWLKLLARFPHVMNTWFGLGHTFPNSESANPYTPDTQLCCAFFDISMTTPKEFWRLDLEDGRSVGFIGLYFITADEMQFKLEHGAEALHDRLAFANVTELVQPARKSVLQESFVPDPADVVGTSFATNPGHIPVRWRTLLKHFPSLWVFPVIIWFSLALCVRHPWAGTGIILVVGWRWVVPVWRLRRLKRWFQSGNMLPGIVVQAEPLQVAVLANLTNDGSDPYYAVKIEEQLFSGRKVGLKAGARVPTVCCYGQDDQAAGAELSRWSDITAWAVQFVNDDPAVIEKALSTFDSTDWSELDRALEQVPTRTKPGLFPVDLSRRRVGANPPAPPNNPLRIRGSAPVSQAVAWHVVDGEGKACGPYSPEVLRQYIKEGLVNAQSLAQTTGEQTWLPLAEHPQAKGWFDQGSRAR